MTSMDEKDTSEYVIVDGDTFNSVAARFDTTPGELRRLNRQRFRSGELLYPGLRLTVPRSSSSSSTTKDAEIVSAPRDPDRPSYLGARPRFVRANARLMTRCEGVASGCLLVTPNSLLFEPSLSDPLVVDRGPEAYCVARPVAGLAYLAAYTSPELIGTRPDDRPAQCQFEYRPNIPDDGSSASPAMPIYLCFGCRKFDQKLSSTSNSAIVPPSTSSIDEFWFTTRRSEADALLKFCRNCCGVGRRGRRRRRKRRPTDASGGSCSHPSDQEAGTVPADPSANAAASSPSSSASADEYGDNDDCYDDFVDDHEAWTDCPKDCSHPDYYRGLLAAMSAAPNPDKKGDNSPIGASLPTRFDLPLPRRIFGDSADASGNQRSNYRWLLTRRRLRHLVAALPSRAESLDLRLVHSARRDGFSLKSAYRACRLLVEEIGGGAREPYSLLLVATVTGRVFGAFLSAEPRVSERRYYGTGETFVFRWERPDCCSAESPPKRDSNSCIAEAAKDSVDQDSDSDSTDLTESEADKDFYPYAWTGENMFFIRGELEHFSVGSSSGRCAIWLDSDLCRGRSQPCDTFNSPVLSGVSSADEDFLVRDLEIWAFVDPIEG